MLVKKKKVLIVDDSKYIRYALETALQKKGFETHTCINGAEALEAIKVQKYDLIVSDVIMPKCDGFEFWEEMRNIITPNSATPVLFISGGSRTVCRTTALEILRTQAHVMAKPLNQKQFFNQVNSLVGKAKEYEQLT